MSHFFNYLTKDEVVQRLQISLRTLGNKGRLYEKTLGTLREIPPNSPRNGLRRSYTSERKYLFDERDLIEYEQNGFLEKTGGELWNWRKGPGSYGSSTCGRGSHHAS
jgi:hypothetical protein